MEGQIRPFQSVQGSERDWRSIADCGKGSGRTYHLVVLANLEDATIMAVRECACAGTGARTCLPQKEVL